jgi:A/G-specific adenine glycosylase
MRFEHLGLQNFLITEAGFAKDEWFELKSYEIFGLFSLDYHLWSFLKDRDCQFAFLSKEDHVRSLIELEVLFQQESPKSLGLFWSKRCGVRIHPLSMRQFDLEITEFRALLVAWYAREGRRLPWRETADPYQILVSELMLQQTQVATVLAYYHRWLTKFPTLATLAAANEQEVLRAWQGLGYYDRARNLHRCAKRLVDSGDGKLPENVTDLVRLPGIGRYTAGAIVSFAFNKPAPILDANVTRVLARLINLQASVDAVAGKRILWEIAENLVKDGEPRTVNSAIMELGALLCAPRNPRCVLCPVRTFCRAVDPNSLPRKRTRPATQKIRENYWWIRQEETVLLRHVTGRRWHRLWTLPPAAEISSDQLPLFQIQHPITKYLVCLTVFTGAISEVFPESWHWQSIAALRDLPMPTPHRSAVQAILETERR